MSQASASDRRRSPRRGLAAGVTLSHQPTGRDWSARGVDISEGGMLLYISAKAPVAPGQRVELVIDERRQGQYVGLAGRAIQATIVHVEREQLPRLGYIPVGVSFARPLDKLE